MRDVMDLAQRLRRVFLGLRAPMLAGIRTVMAASGAKSCRFFGHCPAQGSAHFESKVVASSQMYTQEAR